MLFIECSIVFFILYVSDLANQGTLSGMSCVIELSQLSRAKHAGLTVAVYSGE